MALSVSPNVTRCRFLKQGKIFVFSNKHVIDVAGGSLVIAIASLASHMHGQVGFTSSAIRTAYYTFF